MSFRKAGHADSEPARSWMCARFVESPNELHQIDRVLKGIPRFVVGNVMRPIAPERANVPNGRLSVSNQNVFDLFFTMTDAGHVGDWIQFCCVLTALDEVVSYFSPRGTGPIRRAND